MGDRLFAPGSERAPMIGAMTEYRVGDAFSPGDLSVVGPDCKGQDPSSGVFCVLDDQHEGQHVAADGHFMVVAVWAR